LLLPKDPRLLGVQFEKVSFSKKENIVESDGTYIESFCCDIFLICPVIIVYIFLMVAFRAISSSIRTHMSCEFISTDIFIRFVNSAYRICKYTKVYSWLRYMGSCCCSHRS